MYVKGNQVSYDQADSILVEPWGGTGGSEWNYKLKSPIKEILIAHGDIIDSIMFRTIVLPSTHQSLVGVEVEETSHSVIKSLCFITNAKNYGPFGFEAGGTPFSLVMKQGVAIVGFHGRCGAYLDAIGVYLQKLALPKQRILWLKTLKFVTYVVIIPSFS
ncbi:mannose/glucose-specific lectin-like [Nicotiana tomentosiformis]|uniref:mannose/glucose-specific lectin-like n=1 Tax=Nicotiana tomentosiformis TaxID=4098 RepID=UPI00388C8FDE